MASDNKDYSMYLTDEVIESLNVQKLKDYLRRHGQSVTGKKDQLIKRAKGVRLIQSENKDTLQQKDTDEALKRSQDKNVTPLGEVIPDISKLTNWSRDVNNIPDFCDKDIYNYFVLKMNTKRQLRSKVYYDDGHVYDIEYNAVNEKCSHCVVKAKVIPSIPTANQKLNPDHDTWVIISKETGNVHSANCDCTAGMGESCNHVAAVMYAMADISNRKKEGKLSCTSEKQKWHVPRKRKISPKKAQDIKFRKYEFCAESENSKGKSELFRSPDEKKGSCIKEGFTCTVNIERLAENLRSCEQQIGWLTFFEKSVLQSEDTIPELHSIIYQYSNNVDLKSHSCREDFNTRFTAMKISQEDCDKIAVLTKGQASNLLWHDSKKQRITSSNFGAVCKLKENTKPNNTLKRVLGYSHFQSAFTEWGIKHEAAAKRKYILMTGRKVIDYGLLINPKFPHLGTSPDGLIKDDGLLEIKCPASFKWRNCAVEECCHDPQFYCSLDENDKPRLKMSHDYYFQIQGQLALSCRKWCDFVVWTLKGVSIERIYFNDIFWSQMLQKLNKFYIDAFIPELMSSRVKRGLQLL